jgi:WD40-like Beta Propeller Repeat
MNAPVRIVLALVALAVVVPPAQAAFPGRNGAIAYTFFGSSGDLEPFVEQAGLKARLISREEPRTLVNCERTGGVPSDGDCTATQFLSPSYSPDGSRLVFDAGERLGAIGAGGAGLYLVAPVTADDGDPSFAPDGKRVVFTGANDQGGTDVWRATLGGMFARLIVKDASMPAWSTRNAIAFVRDGKTYVARHDGSHQRLVTSGVSPDWSPDGGRLAIVRPLRASAGTLGRIYVVGARGCGLRRIGRVKDASNPVWSPYGLWLAYDRFDAGIFVKPLRSDAPARQVATTQISGESGSAVAYGPTWRPLPR